jgi:hypothetical protein
VRAARNCAQVTTVEKDLWPRPIKEFESYFPRRRRGFPYLRPTRPEASRSAGSWPGRYRLRGVLSRPGIRRHIGSEP